MIKKKKKRVFLQIYVLMTVFLISFFTIYAFRYKVYDFLFERNYIQQESVKALKARIRPLVKEKHMQLENINDLQDKLDEELKDYDYEIIAKTTSNHIKYMFASKGFLVYKDGWTYEKKLKYYYDKGSIMIVCFPKLYTYLDYYSLVCIIFSLFICLVSILFYRYMKKNRIIFKIANHFLQNRRFFKLNHLSSELLIVNIIALTATASLFVFLYINRYSPLEFFKDMSFFRENMIEDMDSYAEQIQEQIHKLDIEKDGDKIEKIFKAAMPHHSILSLSDSNNDTRVYVSYNGVYDDFMYGIYNSLIVRRPFDFYYVMECNSKYAMFSISYFPFIYYMQLYIIAILLFSFSYYLILVQLFIKRKIEAILLIQEDASILSQGDWNHTFRYKGIDEIGELSDELRCMQSTYYENMQNEKKARQANQELVTSLSHDLRTPLTSLLGYLELIRYREGTTEQKRVYLDRSLQKVEQIRSLSDKLFEYFLVYEKEDSLELVEQPIERWLDYVRENVEFMQQDGLSIHLQLEALANSKAAYNMEMLQRAMDNLFSNLHKYADRSSTIEIQGYHDHTAYHLCIKNRIRKNEEKVESNRIGLKSTEKIMQLHHGSLRIEEKDAYFCIEVQLPLSSTE